MVSEWAETVHSLSLKGCEIVNNIEKKVWDLSDEAVESEGCFIYLVEYVKEGKDRILRILIDAEEGVNINQCENISRKVSDILDEADPIPDSYVLEVSSAGLERRIVLPWHFEGYTGEMINVGLYAPECGSKKHVGILKEYIEKKSLTLEVDGEDRVFDLKNISSVNLYFEF